MTARSLALRCLLPHSRQGWRLLQAEYTHRERLRESSGRPASALDEATRQVLLAHAPTPGLRGPDLQTARQEVFWLLLGRPKETP